MINAAKYISSIPLVFLSPASYKWGWLGSTMFAACWDIVVDWGVFEGVQASTYIVLIASVFNITARCCWGWRYLEVLRRMVWLVGRIDRENRGDPVKSAVQVKS
jgi:hypothetical protein